MKKLFFQFEIYILNYMTNTFFITEKIPAELFIRNILLGDVMKKHQCPRCYKLYKHAHILRRHLEFECGQDPKFQCSVCGHKSKRKYEMTLHIKRKHLRR